MIGAIVRCYRLTKYLPAVLQNLKWVDTVVLANHRFKNVAHGTPDDTLEIYSNIRSKYPNVLYNYDQDVIQHGGFNKCIKWLGSCDYILINDADEFIREEDYRHIISEMKATNRDAGFTNIIDYTRFDERLPERTHRPVVCIKPTVNFWETRACGYGEGRHFNDIYMHHFGYCYDGIDMNWKHDNLWYEKYGMDSLVCRERSKCELPVWLKLLLEENGVKDIKHN